MNDFIAQYTQAFQDSEPLHLLAFGVFFLCIYFLPTLLAVFFNRKQLTKIAILNVPAGFSMLIWGGLIVWACTGKLGQGLAKRMAKEEAKEPA
jgi:hypothetical protein